MTSPPPGVRDLHDEFITETDKNRKGKLLGELAHTPPAGTRDVESLFDIFMRFADPQARQAVLASIQLINFENPDLDVLLVHYLQQPEPEAKMFALKAIARVHDTKALPLIEKIADYQFPYKSADDAVLLTDKNEWWVHYESLAVLAQWNGEQAIPMLIKKTEQAPELSRIMGFYLWKPSLPYFVQWSRSSSHNDQDRAHAGLAAPTPTLQLRATREQMLALLRDAKSPKELRHQLAIKIGLSSTHEEVEGLLKEHEALKDPADRLMFLAALFASRDRLVAPLLTQTAKEDLSPLTRAGALIELKDMLPEAEMRSYWAWTSENDPDLGNREMALRELKLLPPPIQEIRTPSTKKPKPKSNPKAPKS